MPIESSSWCQCSLSHDLCIAVFSVLNQLLHMWLKLAGKIIEKLIISSLSLEISLLVFCSVCFLSILKHYYFVSWDLKIKFFFAEWATVFLLKVSLCFEKVLWRWYGFQQWYGPHGGWLTQWFLCVTRFCSIRQYS